MTTTDVATRIDLTGIVCFGAMMAALLVFLMTLPTVNGTAAIITVVAAAAFAVRELKAPAPFVDLRSLAKNGGLSRTYV